MLIAHSKLHWVEASLPGVNTMFMVITRRQTRTKPNNTQAGISPLSVSVSNDVLFNVVQHVGSGVSTEICPCAFFSAKGE